MVWPNEGSVTAVSASAVHGHCTMTVGDQCKVTMNKKEYNGKVAEKGTNVIYIFHILKSFTGTRVEMDRVEDKFVTGEWIPPFIAPSPAPTRKTKTKKTRCNLLQLLKEKR